MLHYILPCAVLYSTALHYLHCDLRCYACCAELRCFTSCNVLRCTSLCCATTEAVLLPELLCCVVLCYYLRSATQRNATQRYAATCDALQ